MVNHHERSFFIMSNHPSSSASGISIRGPSFSILLYAQGGTGFWDFRILGLNPLQVAPENCDMAFTWDKVRKLEAFDKLVADGLFNEGRLVSQTGC